MLNDEEINLITKLNYKRMEDIFDYLKSNNSKSEEFLKGYECGLNSINDKCIIEDSDTFDLFCDKAETSAYHYGYLKGAVEVRAIKGWYDTKRLDVMEEAFQRYGVNHVFK